MYKVMTAELIFNKIKKLQFPFSPVSLLTVLLLAGLFGCQSKQVAEGKKTFDRYCAPCHGDSGAGDGYNAKNLDPHARDLTDKQESYMAKLKNEEIYEVIEKGGAGVDLAPTMPSWGKTLSQNQIWSLVAYIRTLHKYEGTPVKFDEAKPYDAKHPRSAAVTEGEFVSLMGTRSSDQVAKDELVKLGEELFGEYGCVGCHRILGTGGQLGPDLSRAGFMLQPQFIYRWVRNPQSFLPETRMPNLNLSEEDAFAVAMYLGTLKHPPQGKGAQVPVPKPTSTPSVEMSSGVATSETATTSEMATTTH
ncbi:MAG: c-type cytochrome [Nitrospirota bacterium]